MNFSEALRATEILLAVAFCLQSLEHLRGFKYERYLFSARLLFSLLLLFAVYTSWMLLALFVIALLQLQRFQGPYNGGADRMGLLILCCVLLAHLASDVFWQEMALGYLALQLTFSYFFAGWVKLVNPEWRNGQALRDVFAFSAYPVSESLRGWSNRTRLLWLMSWAVVVFELLLPLALVTKPTLLAMLGIAAIFHLANACLFGLNRFVWIWIAAYPSLLWLQQRLSTF